MKKMILWIGLIFIFGCEASDEVKMRDTEEALSKVEFEQQVFENIKELNILSDLIKSNIDSIFSHNGLILKESNEKFKLEHIRIFENSIEQTLPNNIALEMRTILNSLPPKMFYATTVYNDTSIIYNIIPKKNQTVPVNYREQHKLVYNKVLTTTNELSSVLDNISKDTFLSEHQYYIQLEPYIGW